MAAPSTLLAIYSLTLTLLQHSAHAEQLHIATLYTLQLLSPAKRLHILLAKTLQIHCNPNTPTNTSAEYMSTESHTKHRDALHMLH